MNHERFLVGIVLVIGALLIVFAGIWNTATTSASLQDQKSGTVLVANGSVEANIRGKGGAISVKGRTSMSFEMSGGELKVRQFNVVFPDTPQASLSGRDPKSRSKNGPLGLSIPASEKSVALRYDAQRQTISGEIPVQLHYPQIDEIYPPEFRKDDRESDVAVSRTQKGTVKVEIKLSEPLDKAAARSNQRQTVKISGNTSAIVDVEGLGDLPPYRLEWRASALIIDIGLIRWWESASSLCIQPVRIRSSASDPSPTGAGLAFGLPGANTQWNKVDVVFQVRSFMSVTNSGWKIATAGDEEVAIRGSVDVADCIEVFFVENFSPESLHGGGATWGAGTASAKIITSDGNATFGVDLTHLAHELGHVLNMDHPGAPNGLYNASRNTLMCPSGWHNDNPKRNSRDNGANVSNPLLVWTLKTISGGPDCNNNGDCGNCP